MFSIIDEIGFYIKHGPCYMEFELVPRLTNDMKIGVQKNHLEGQILYRSLVASKNGVKEKMVGIDMDLIIGNSDTLNIDAVFP